MGKVCCFIGHRTVKKQEELYLKIKETVSNLIKEGFDTFLFGSRSDFDTLCLKAVTELKNTAFPFIIRKQYTCRHETCVLEKDRIESEIFYFKYFKKPIILFGVEEEVHFKNRYTAGRGNYVERNEEMILSSDICVFYYDKNYVPPDRKYGRRFLTYYTPNSGTNVAYKFAVQKKKEIINLFL